MPVKNGKKMPYGKGTKKKTVKRKVAEKALGGLAYATFGVVKKATQAGQRLDKLLGTENMTAFPLQKPSTSRKKKK